MGLGLLGAAWPREGAGAGAGLGEGLGEGEGEGPRWWRRWWWSGQQRSWRAWSRARH